MTTKKERIVERIEGASGGTGILEKKFSLTRNRWENTVDCSER